MPYRKKGTYQIEKKVVRELRANGKTNSLILANNVGETLEYTEQGVCHARKNVLLPNESIVKTGKKIKGKRGNHSYEILQVTTPLKDSITEFDRNADLIRRKFREISKLLHNATKNIPQSSKMQLKNHIVNLMTEINRDLNMINVGVTPTTNL